MDRFDQPPIKPQPTQFVVTLQATADDTRPAAVRLRQFLKTARRAWCLRCISIVAVTGDHRESIAQ